MIRKVCVVTGSRAEYGLLRWVMEGIQQDEQMVLQLIVTGMHLSPEFDLTYRVIEEDGFQIDFKIEMLLSSDTPVGVTKSIGLGVIGFADALEQLKPDLLVVLGDRFEILAAVSAAMVACIPVAHLHGGEVTEAAIDEAIRHAITKMSHLHFTAAEPYRRRVIQLGEQPEKVFNVGGLGIDYLKRQELLDCQALEKALDIQFDKKNLLITFHPVTLEHASSTQQMKALLGALETLENTLLIFTLPNADTDGREIMKLIRSFVETHANARSFTSLGQLKYLSCIQYVDGVIGNSSSGLLEVPSFRCGTINIGNRQCGRLKAESVIDCLPDKLSILKAIEVLYSIDFQTKLDTVRNPYGDGGASDKIVCCLRDVELANIIKKPFYDI